MGIHGIWLSLVSATLLATTTEAGLVPERARSVSVPRDFNVKATTSLPLRKGSGKPVGDIPSLWKRQNGTTQIINHKDVYYYVDIGVGNQTIPLHIDTGSSDTWIVQSPFRCVDMIGIPRQEKSCGFGTGFQGNLSGGNITDGKFSRYYGDGTFVGGYFGYEDVTIGGLKVPHQQLALVNFTYWYGDSLTSGLMGLAYPFMTGIDEPSKEYNPIFTNMWMRDKSVAPMFSLALSRDDPDTESSVLAFGGVPPNVEYDAASWAKTPIQSMEMMQGWGITTPDRGLYLVVPDAFVYGPRNGSAESEKSRAQGAPASMDGIVTNKTQTPYLIDAGSTLTRLPAPLAHEIFASFDPPAEYLYTEGAWYADCNAIASAFGVTIGGRTFWIQPADLLRQTTRDRETNTKCRVGIYDDETPPYILGITFLTNVIAVFDVGETEMRFAARKHY